MLVTFSEEFIDWILRAATTSPHNEVNLQNNTTEAERMKREGNTPELGTKVHKVFIFKTLLRYCDYKLNGRLNIVVRG